MMHIMEMVNTLLLLGHMMVNGVMELKMVKVLKYGQTLSNDILEDGLMEAITVKQNGLMLQELLRMWNIIVVNLSGMLTQIKMVLHFNSNILFLLDNVLNKIRNFILIMDNAT